MVLRAANQKPLIASGNHTFIYRLLAARHVPNTTCVVERYHPIHGTPNVAAMIHRHMQRNEWNPCRQTKPPTDMSFRGSEASRGIFPSCKLFLVLVILATWEDPSTPFHFGRDDISRGGSVLSARIITGTSPERHTGRSLRFR